MKILFKTLRKFKIVLNNFYISNKYFQKNFFLCESNRNNLTKYEINFYSHSINRFYCKNLEKKEKHLKLRFEIELMQE
jgi:hypothetical protein